MTELQQPLESYKVPEYRVRLFLSVDLTGSTAYKHDKSNRFEWIKVFQKFYGDFPKTLTNFYKDIGQKANLSSEEINDGIPKLWKTVGDEILFCCRILSIHHVSVCMESFIQSLEKFGNEISDKNLNTKGNAWIASFPIPNSSIKPIDENFTDDALSGSNELVTEDFELEADRSPKNFDFLGKGIDSGFRISKNSSINAVTISPGLGILLLTACNNPDFTNFKRKIRLLDMQSFKGVAKNEPYPVLVIDVFRNKKYESIFNDQNKFLGKGNLQSSTELKDFLINFLEYYDIEIPSVKLNSKSPDHESPKFYEEYREKWESEKMALQQKSQAEKESASSDDSANADSSNQLDSKDLHEQEVFADELLMKGTS